MRLMTALAAVLLFQPAGLAAQDEDERIIVTGSRIERFERDEPPYITLHRRADELSVSIRVECDTRDRVMRIQELRQTLINLSRRAARRSDFDLGVTVDRENLEGEVIVDLTEAQINSMDFQRGYRPDTSVADVSLVTPIGADDTPAQLEARLEAFLESVELVGRTTMSEDMEEAALVITGGPERYRLDMLAAIAANARDTQAAFGDRFTVQIGGLENAMRWQRADALDLNIYLPYELLVGENG